MENVGFLLLGVLATFLSLQFVFGQIDRLLKMACQATRLDIPMDGVIERQNRLREWINQRWLSPVAWLHRVRLWISIQLSERKEIHRIHSDPLADIVRQAYSQGMDDAKTQCRLRKYVKKRSKCSEAASLEVLRRWVDSSTFTLVSPKKPLLVGLGACLEVDPLQNHQRRLVLAMELWIVLIYMWAWPIETHRENEQGASRIAHRLLWPFRKLMALLIREGVTHELVHVLQEINDQMLTREFEQGTDRTRLPLRMWAKCEIDALWFGSPMWVVLLALGLLPLIYWSANAY